MDSIFSTSTDIADFSSYYRARYTTVTESSSQSWTATQIILFLAIIIVFIFQMKILMASLKWRAKPRELHCLLTYSCDSNTESALSWYMLICLLWRVRKPNFTYTNVWEKAVLVSRGVWRKEKPLFSGQFKNSEICFPPSWGQGVTQLFWFAGSPYEPPTRSRPVCVLGNKSGHRNGAIHLCQRFIATTAISCRTVRTCTQYGKDREPMCLNATPNSREEVMCGPRQISGPTPAWVDWLCYMIQVVLQGPVD